MKIGPQTEKAPALRNLASRLLGQTAALVGQLVGDALAEAGSHRRHFAVLATLEAFGACSQAELCRRTDLDPSDMNAVITALLTEGTISKSVDTLNRRRNIITLSPEGRIRYRALQMTVAEAQSRAFAPLSDAERVELVRLLQRVHEHVAPL